ncbi:MAG: hypothetical protein ABIS06_03650 [Vicinamibacterales bacterium]
MMTLAESLDKANRDFDAIAERILRDCELMYVDMGADPDELAAGLARERATLADGRRQLLSMVRTAFAVGFDAPSARVH